MNINPDKYNELLSTALMQIDDLVVITNKDGIIEYVNPAFEKFTVYTSKEAIGKKSYLLKIEEIKKNYIIIIDFSNCVYIDSVFVGTLVNIVKKRDLKKEEIIIIVDQKKLQSNMFLLANIERLFVTFSDVQSALTSIIKN